MDLFIRTTLKLYLIIFCAITVRSTLSRQTIITGTGCDALQSYKMLSCTNIDMSNIDIVKQILVNIISMHWPEIHAIFDGSAIQSFPNDIFVNSPLTSLVFSVQCTFNGFPNGILRNVKSNLNRLQFKYVQGIDSLANSDFVELPFLNSLQFFSFEANVSIELMDFAFSSLVNLKQLVLRQNLLSALPESVFCGLSSLIELDLSANSLTALPKTVFSPVQSLTTLWLNDNQLHLLDKSLFYGLKDLQFVSVTGNPFNCSCDLQWFKDWLQEKHLLEESGARCKYPIDIPFDQYEFCQTEQPFVFINHN